MRRSLLLAAMLVLASCGGDPHRTGSAVQGAPMQGEPVATIETAPETRPRMDAKEARANVRAGVVAAETYYSSNQTYAGLTSGVLRTVDPLLRNVTVGLADARSYCIQSTVGAATFSMSGPAADLVRGPCA
jgi:hypothetical protein